MTPHKTLFFLTMVLALNACHDDDTTNVAPVKKRLRAETMSYGDISYRTMEYDDQNKVSHIISGLIVEGDSSEARHEVLYNRDKPVRLVLDDSWEIRYVYTGDIITSADEYIDGKLFQHDEFQYNDKQLVTTWFTYQQNEEGESVPHTKTTYEYDQAGNAIRVRFFIYEHEHQAFRNYTTMEYEDFDNKKNSFPAFWGNMDNPQLVLFVNNPRTIRVLQDNGSRAENHYTFEYNDAGFVTRQQVVEGGHAILYSFEEY